MLTRKVGTGTNSFDIDPVDDIMDCANGIVGCLEGEGINCIATEPETIIVIRTNQATSTGDRLFSAKVYTDGNVEKVVNDLLTAPRP